MTSIGARSAALGCLVVLFVVHLVYPDGTIGEIAYPALALAAALVAWFGARRATTDRRAVRYFAIGLTFSAIGACAYAADLSSLGGTHLYVADVAWFVSTSSYVVAAVELARSSGGGGRQRITRLLDVVAIVVVTALIEWQFAVAAFVSEGNLPAFVRAGTVLYPLADALVLALAVWVLVANTGSLVRPALVAVAAVAWVVSDLTALVAPDPQMFTTWTGNGWAIGYVLIAAATFEWSGSPRTTRERSLRTGIVGLLLILVPLLVPGGIQLFGHMTYTHVDPVPLLAATAVLVALAFVRSRGLLVAEFEARAQIRSRGRYAEAVAANSSDAVVVLDAQGRIQSDASALALLVARPMVTVPGTQVFSAMRASDPDAARDALARVVRTPDAVHQVEVQVRHGAGRDMWLNVRMVNLLFDPDVNGVLVNVHDITHRKLAESELTHRAFHDGLTGLANRVLFIDRTEQALRRTARTATSVAVVYIDLDGFKSVNDSMGHECGDELLRAVARRIQGEVRAEDTVARLGGDEFAVLVEQSEDVAHEAEAVAERIHRALTIPASLHDRMFTISASLGIAISDPMSTSSMLLRDADLAMYQAKAQGRGRVAVFDQSMRAAVAERRRIEDDLSEVAGSGQLTLLYQPIVELVGGEVVGFEALLRWEHPTLGYLTPEQFVPVAEETGLIVPLGRWVFGEACRTAARWHRQHPRRLPLTMAVNVSAGQLEAPGFADDVAELLADSGLEASALVLEITEESLVRDSSVVADALAQVRALGVRVAVDDFGVGYSSLRYLRELPVDILKVDRSFVATLTDSGEPSALVGGLLALGRTLGLEVVAEGVERVEQRDQLRAEGCVLAQGFLFDPPLTAEAAEARLAESQGERAAFGSAARG